MAKKILKKVFGIFTVLSLCASKAAFCQETSGTSGQLLANEIDTVKNLINILIEFSIKYGFQVLGGFIVLLLGWIIAKALSGFLSRFLEKKNVDITVSKFLVSIFRLLIMAFAVLVALGKFGITIAPFIAGLSVVGFGTSFALQGPLSNYAAGMTLIFTKPFKVGDIIEVTGVMGEVQDMTLARTEVKTVDGTRIMIPNKQIIGEIIHNYSEFKKLDITVGISYDSDIEKAVNVVKDVVRQNKKISSSPEPKIGVSEFADSSINVYARLWCKQKDYWDVMFEVNKGIFDQFKINSINIPFPQRDLHIYKDMLV